MRPRIRGTLSDRRKVFAIVSVLTILTIVIVETVTVRTAHTELIRRTDSSLRAQIQNAKVAIKVLSPEALLSLSKVDLIASDAAVITIAPTGKVVYTVPARISASKRVMPVVPALAVLKRQLGEGFTIPGVGGTPRFRAMAGEVGLGLTIVYATPLTAVDGTIADLRHDALLVTIVAVLLLALILWRVMAAATKPIDSMIDVAARIGDGDFTARLDPAELHGDAARLGVALNQMVTRIQSAFAETSASEAKLRRFVADASHELRTPLTSIRGYAQLLRIGAAGDDAETATRRIDSEATRMALLVDDLLFLARLDQGRPLERESVDVAAIVRELGADARLLDPERPIEVEVPEAPVLVLGDEGRVRQLLTNLLANVRRHTGPRTRCTLRVRTINSDVLITVADNGEGMAADDAAHAFDRFYRADASRNRDSGGNGLGLAIAKAIVEAHGGEIELTSAVGAGTSVSVRLPGVRREVADERATPHLAPTRQPT
jgi:two-component system, OmpR family, sensor kinase